MSAESDLLFPQVDSFMLPDFSNFSDYEDFSKDIFIMSDIDGISLLEDLDCKDGLKPLLMSELNDFSCSLEGIKEEDEEEDMHSAKIHEKGHANKPSEEVRGLLQDKSKFGNGLHTEADNVLISTRTMLTTNEMSCMSLEEDISQSNSEKSWHALTPPFKQVTAITSSDAPVNASSQEDRMASLQSKETSLKETGGTLKNGIMQSSCVSENTSVLSPLQQVTASGRGRVMINSIMHGDTRPAITPPIFHINSPLSSPSSSVSTPDGSSIFKMFGQEESVNKHPMNSSIMQPAVSVDPGLRSPKGDPFYGAIPHHVMQDVSSFTTMHRSRSSHALGQFRTPGHLITCPEELNLSSMQMPTMGYSSVSNFTSYQASSSPGLAERSPTTPMRRVFSAGDIQARYGDSNLSRLEHPNNEEHVGLKVGHYTLEERKVRLDRYRQKRNERNFSKKIKYACRKTLADSRPRIRGRFARTLDDSGEPLLRENGASYDDEYEEVDMLSAHCSIPNNRAVSFWSATGMNARFHHGR